MEIIDEKDFEQQQKAVYLTQGGRKKVIKQFDAKLESVRKYNGNEKTYREIIMAQAEKYKTAVLSGTSYEPFIYK